MIICWATEVKLQDPDLETTKFRLQQTPDTPCSSETVGSEEGARPQMGVVLGKEFERAFSEEPKT